MEFFSSSPILAFVGTWIGGMLSGILILLLKGRRALLTYRVTHNQIGLTADDAVHGRVEVLYRGQLVSNLWLSIVEIQNRSIRDLENLDIKTLRGTADVLMLTEQSHVRDTLEGMNLTDEYVARITANSEWEASIRQAGTQEEPENAARLRADWALRHGQRHYKLPVLNRRQTVTVTYLTIAPTGVTPSIHLVCNTKGVRVKEKFRPAVPQEVFGVPLPQAGLVGLTISPIVLGIVVWQLNAPWLPAAACFAVGILATVIGAVMVRVFGFLRDRVIG